MGFEGQFYLAHPYFMYEQIRAWELEAEKRVGIDFYNPFYDGKMQQDEFKKLNENPALRLDRSWIDTEKIVPPDLKYIADKKGLVSIFSNVPMAGTPMELFFAALLVKIPTFSLGLDFISPWMVHHTSKKQVAKSFDELESQLIAYRDSKDKESYINKYDLPFEITIKKL